MENYNLKDFIEKHNTFVLPFEEFEKERQKYQSEQVESAIDFYNIYYKLIQKDQVVDTNKNMIEQLIEYTNILTVDFGSINFRNEIDLDSSLSKFAFTAHFDDFAFSKENAIYLVNSNNETELFSKNINNFLDFLLNFKYLWDTHSKHRILDNAALININNNTALNLNIVNELLSPLR